MPLYKAALELPISYPALDSFKRQKSGASGAAHLLKILGEDLSVVSSNLRWSLVFHKDVDVTSVSTSPPFVIVFIQISLFFQSYVYVCMHIYVHVFVYVGTSTYVGCVCVHAHICVRMWL